MVKELSSQNVNQIFKKYYKLLSVTGYASHDTVSKVLVAAFLLDFLNTAYEFLTDTEKVHVQGAFEKLRVHDNCVFV